VNSPLYHPKGQSLYLQVKVHPQGGRDSVSLTKNGELKVTVTAPPQDGEANQAVVKTLSKWLGIKKSSVEVIQGQSSRHKIVSLPIECEETLASLIHALSGAQ
jgi:uncharacterized protein (TIGR00251 family)